MRAALQQIGISLDEQVITVNLAPADLKKSGGSYDLAIALATLAALGRIRAADLEGTAFLGELSLTGIVRAVRGVLPALRGAVAHGVSRAIVPQGNASEAACVPGIDVVIATTWVASLVTSRQGGACLDPAPARRSRRISAQRKST